MCTELESAGLQHPVYYVDAFILKTIIYNASAEKTIIGENNPIIQKEKLTIEEMRCAIAKKSFDLPTQKNIFKVYDEIDEKQVLVLLRYNGYLIVHLLRHVQLCLN